MKHRFFNPLLAGVLTLTLAACGGAGAAEGVASLDGNAAASQDAGAEEAPEDLEAELVEWTECMREQGVDIPDARVTGDGGVMITRRVEGPGAGAGAIDLDDLDKAQEECGEPPMGPAGGGRRIDVEELREQGLKMAQCMRENGIEDFPDPDFSNMGPGVQVERRSSSAVRVAGPFGEIDMDDPEVREAFETCGKEAGMPFAVGFAPAPAG